MKVMNNIQTEFISCPKVRQLEEKLADEATLDGIGTPRFYNSRLMPIDHQENKRICRELKLIFALLMKTVARVVREKDYEGFCFPPEVIKAIEKSWTDQDPFIIGRFDIRYEPGKPLLCYEMNVSCTGHIAEMYMREIFLPHVIEDAKPNVILGRHLRAVWKNVARHMENARVNYIAEPNNDDQDAAIVCALGAESSGLRFHDALNLRWKRVDKEVSDSRSISFLKAGIEFYPRSPTVVGQADVFYMWHQIVRRKGQKMFPAPWTLLLDNKAIWAHVWKDNVGHPNLIPTTFDFNDFMPGGVLHEGGNNQIRAKPVFSCAGAGQTNYYQDRNIPYGVDTECASGKIFSAYRPEYKIDHIDRLKGWAFVVGDGEAVKYDLRSDNIYCSYVKKPSGAASPRPDL
ncbi:MAG: hypothetical protein EBZ69_04590 [Alphaproteobacteria bacterium]|nr:hypothetical protein [Alphaproteobacteria bacterium]NDC56075.1 hypothetical protein [Alphaproteobacteria bacterium]NDG04804.1 hypothetical protein [Alphaproteobacteria bacterium]